MHRYKVITLIILIGVGFILVRNTAGTKEDSEQKLKTAVVSKGHIAAVVKETGEVQPRRLVEVKSRVSGEVESIYVTEGELVKKDDVLVQLDTTDILNELKEVKADVKAAKAKLELLVEGFRSEEVAEAKAAMEAAAAKLKLSEAELERSKKLFKDGVISRSEFEDVQKDLDVAQAEHVQAKQQYEMKKKGNREQDIRIVTADLEKARHRYNMVKDKLSYTKITSPINGVVLECPLEEGEAVTQGTVSTSVGTLIMRIGDMTEMYVDVYINEVDIDRVKVGNYVTISLDAIRDKLYRGLVSKIVPYGQDEDGIVKFKVKVKFKEFDDRVKTGMTADVDIFTAAKHDVLVVPLEAIRYEDGQFRATVIQGRKEIEQEVVVGIESDTMREIVSGLKEGDVVKIVPAKRREKPKESRMRRAHGPM